MTYNVFSGTLNPTQSVHFVTVRRIAYQFIHKDPVPEQAEREKSRSNALTHKTMQVVLTLLKRILASSP